MFYISIPDDNSNQSILGYQTFSMDVFLLVLKFDNAILCNNAVVEPEKIIFFYFPSSVSTSTIVFHSIVISYGKRVNNN